MAQQRLKREDRRPRVAAFIAASTSVGINVQDAASPGAELWVPAVQVAANQFVLDVLKRPVLLRCSSFSGTGRRSKPCSKGCPGTPRKRSENRLSGKLSQKYSMVSDLENQSLLMRHAPEHGRPTTDGTDRVRHPANTNT